MEIDGLYQDIILDHYRHPRHKGQIPEETALVDEENPLCGDHLRLTASVENGKVKSVQFDGKGCVISMASASMMTEVVLGKTVEEARKISSDIVSFLKGESEVSGDRLGDLIALEGVKKYPLRVKCATLSWHAFDAAMSKLGA